MSDGIIIVIPPSSLVKINLSDQNLDQAFIHILYEKISLLEKKSDFKVLRKKVSLSSDADQACGEETEVEPDCDCAKHVAVKPKSVTLRVESVLVHAISVWGRCPPLLVVQVRRESLKLIQNYFKLSYQVSQTSVISQR